MGTLRHGIIEGTGNYELNGKIQRNVTLKKSKLKKDRSFFGIRAIEIMGRTRQKEGSLKVGIDIAFVIVYSFSLVDF